MREVLYLSFLPENESFLSRSLPTLSAVMGDQNADVSYFDEGGATTMKGEEYTWLITNDFDATTKSTDVL